MLLFVIKTISFAIESQLNNLDDMTNLIHAKINKNQISLL